MSRGARCEVRGGQSVVGGREDEKGSHFSFVCLGRTTTVRHRNGQRLGVCIAIVVGSLIARVRSS